APRAVTSGERRRANEPGRAVAVGDATRADAAGPGHTDFAVVCPTAARAADERRRRVVLTIELGIGAGGRGGRRFAAQEAHHVPSALERRADLLEFRVALARRRAAVAVRLAEMRAVAPLHPVEALDLALDRRVIEDFGVAVRGRFADGSRLLGAAR